MSEPSNQGGWYDADAASAAVNAALGIDMTIAGFAPAEVYKSDPRSRRAMFLSGGGASGVYEAGVLQAISISAMHFDALVGTSIGSINTAAYAQLLAMRDTATTRPVNQRQADFLRAILYFWEYVDQSNITNLDSSPARDLVSDLDRLYLSVSSFARFWTANLSPDLLRRPPDPEASGNVLQRLRYQSRRLSASIGKALSWAETGLLLLPSLLGSLLALPLNLVRRLAGRPSHLGDLYTATAATLIARTGGKPESSTMMGGTASSGLAGLAHDIVERAMSSYLPNGGPTAKRSLFGNERIQAVLKEFPALRVYQHGSNESSAVLQQPAVSAIPNTDLGRFRQQAGAEMRFTRTNMRNGNLEVTAVYPLATALADTSQRITDTLQGDASHPAPDITAEHAASTASLLNFILALEAVATYEQLLGKPPLPTGRLVVGNPNLVMGVVASGAFPAAFPPVTLDQLYPIDPIHPDPDNKALRDICRLAALYRASKPPQSQEQLNASRAAYPAAAALKPAVAASIVNRLPARGETLRQFIAACFAFDWPANITDRQLAIVQLAACIVATWYDGYPLYQPQAQGGEEAFVEQYNDGGAGDALPLGNAIDALEYLIGQTADPANREATHYVYFVHLGDAPLGVRDVGDVSEIDPITGTLPPATLNRYLFYEYLLRYSDLGKRNRYLSDSRLSRKVHGYIKALHDAGVAGYKDELLVEVVNIYPSVPLTSLVAFDVRLGYNHAINRKQIAAGCSDTMRTLWEQVQEQNGAVPDVTADLLQQWLVPSNTVATDSQSGQPRRTLFCRNAACMYRPECPFGDAVRPPTERSALINNYEISSDTSTMPRAGVLSLSKQRLSFT